MSLPQSGRDKSGQKAYQSLVQVERFSMRIRIFETQDLDLDTVAEMLSMADKQANFNPNTHWIVDTIEGESINYNQDEEGLKKRYKELSLKWTGREAVVMWLTSNQISFEVISYDYLAEEQKALDGFYS